MTIPAPSSINLSDRDTSRRNLLAEALWATIIYFLLSVTLTVAAFKNFHVLQIISAAVIITVPTIIAFSVSASRSQARVNKATPKMLARSGVVAIALTLIQASSLRAGYEYFPNFPSEKIQAGGQFVLDSAFHVTIIQNIIARGYPSIGQHLDPYLHYHALSHYFDALIVSAVGLDPWESYGLIYSLKGMAIFSGLIFFSYAAVSRGRERLFWLVAPVTALTLSNSWHIITSHGQWVPIYLLVLSAPWVFDVIHKKKQTLTEYALITLIVVAMSLGKISAGFSFALIVGFYLLISQPRNIRVYALGALWAGFFYVWGTGFQGPNTVTGLADGFRNVPPEAFALLGLILVTYAMHSWTKEVSALRLSFSLGLSLLIISLVSIFLVRSPNDGAFFFMGLFSVAFLMSAQSVLRRQKFAEKAPVPRNSDRFLPMLVITLFVLATTPVIAKAPLSPYNRPISVVDSIYLTNTVTYLWHNALRPATEHLSILEALAGADVATMSELETPFVVRFRNTLATYLESEDLAQSDALLFLSLEDFQTVAEWSNISPEVGEDLGFLITAVTGVSLIHGVSSLEKYDSFYGMSDYRNDALRIESEEFDKNGTCVWNRPVVYIESLSPIAFGVRCNPL